jgi:hypothetical protein
MNVKNEYTKEIIETLADNEREWRQHTLALIVETRGDVKRQNGRIRKLEIVVAIIVFALFGGAWKLFL